MCFLGKIMPQVILLSSFERTVEMKNCLKININKSSFLEIMPGFTTIVSYFTYNSVK